MFKQIFLPISLVIVFITFVGLLYQGKLPFLNTSVPVNNGNLKVIKINDKEIKVEIAKTDSERAKGLSNRDNLEEDSGMLFVFSENSRPVFWMKDTKIPLDIIWIDDNKIVKIDKNVEPEVGVSDDDLKKYPAPSGIDYVLEVNGGFSDKNGFKVGQTVSGLKQ